VGGIKPGAFKIGNTGGMMDNIVASKLYRPGSVSYVSKSGGMSNELNNIIANTTDGVLEGVAIGGEGTPVLPSLTMPCDTRPTPTARSSCCSVRLVVLRNTA
jgi:succinyl-CoA synthetase alpha subunit